ncbi:MAG TPA: phage terminase large subunit [Phycisphaerales bacterium]|nr:phage terminase large subunit [Phycisphaerales bacterium]
MPETWSDLARRAATLPPSDFAALWESQDDEATRRELLRGRFRWDLEGFCRFCWPDRFNLPFNALHHDLFDVAQSREAWDVRTGTLRDAVAAPRGYAKSTISTFALVVHRIVYGLEAFVVVASAESELAEDFSRDLLEAFRDKESPLSELYGPFAVTGGVEGWRVSVRGAPPVAFLPRSERSAIRGRKHPTRGIRPTLIVLDDAEDKLRVLNPRLRNFTWSWLTKDVAKAGRKEGGTDIWVRGTVLHQYAMLARLVGGKEHGWQARKYKAIVRWPERADLWERCRAIWTDLTLGEHRAPMARAFFEQHRAEMERGAEVLDPEVEDLFRLHEQIWAEGLAAFLQEKQNDPIDPSARVFDPERWARFRVEGDELIVHGTGRRVPIWSLRRTLWWDPTVGGPSSDYGAIAVGGRDGFGYTYVLDLWMQQAPPDAQLAACWTLAERWRIAQGGFEDNGFQELVAKALPREREERREAGRFWRFELVGEPSTTNKEQRIAGIQPDAANGWLLFSDRLPAELVQQAESFPTGDHDDGLDAVERVHTALGGTPIELSQEPWWEARGR